jgi:hypothetical protein
VFVHILLSLLYVQNKTFGVYRVRLRDSVS